MYDKAKARLEVLQVYPHLKTPYDSPVVKKHKVDWSWRTEIIKDLRKRGFKLAQIGLVIGRSRERVRQILEK